MANVTIKDLIDLAKNGYKIGEIKELFELAETAKPKEETPPPVTPKSEEEQLNAFEELIKRENVKS